MKDDRDSSPLFLSIFCKSSFGREMVIIFVSASRPTILVMLWRVVVGLLTLLSIEHICERIGGFIHEIVAGRVSST